MLIKSIKMKNFRQYKDVSITFADDPFKNVTIIMGDNGTGKTTLAQAFQWVLYNDTRFKKNDLLNLQTSNALKENESCIMLVTLDVMYDNVQYTITRSKSFRKVLFSNGVNTTLREESPKFTISHIVNGNTKYLEESRVSYIIKQMLPKDLSRLFFFDGESMDEMAEQIDDGQVVEYKRAVEAIVGLKATYNAVNHLDGRFTERKTYGIPKATVLGKYNTEIEKNSKSAKAMDELNEAIEVLNDNMMKNKLILDEKEKAIEKIDDQIKEKNQIIMRETPAMELKAQYNSLIHQIEKLTKSKSSKISTPLLSNLNSNVYAFFSNPIASKVVIDDNAKSIVPQLAKDSIIHILEEGTCICGQKFEKYGDVYEHIASLLEYAYPKTIGQQISEYRIIKNTNDENAEKCWEEFCSNYTSIRDIDAQINGLTQEAEEKFHQLGNTSGGEQAKKDIITLENTKKDLNKVLIRITAQIQNDEKDLGYKISAKNELVITDDSTMKYKRLFAYTKYLADILAKEYTQKENETRRKLEERMNKIFADIYDGNIKIKVDKKYNIIVETVDEMFSGNEIEKNTAQKYAIIFAFITAVIDLAKENSKKDLTKRIEAGDNKQDIGEEGYPLVMDAPLSAFDKTRILKICDEIPRIADQVIMFIKDTDGEIAEQYLGDKIGAKYSIIKVNDSNLHSDIVGRK